MALKVVMHDQQTIIVLDYRNSKEHEMIDIVTQAKERILELKDPVKVLSIFNDKNFVTPKFMKAAEEQSAQVMHLIDKQSIVGLTPVKKLILKGYNFLFKRNIQNFDTEQEALDFLLNPNTTDKDFTIY
jgi:hypothetical protein